MESKVLVYGGIFLILLIALGGAFVYFGTPSGFTGKFTAVRENSDYELDTRWDCDLVGGRPQWVRTQGALSPASRGRGYLKKSYTDCQGDDYIWTCGTWEQGDTYDTRKLTRLWCSKTHLNYACECYKKKAEEHEEPECTDSDGGKNYAVKGICDGINGTYTDVCSYGYGMIIEHFCDVQTNNCDAVEVFCANNNCQNGKCV
jgi:hypothetical protein